MSDGPAYPPVDPQWHKLLALSAHELRKPLSPIAGYLRMLAVFGPLTDQQQKLIRDIENLYLNFPKLADELDVDRLEICNESEIVHPALTAKRTDKKIMLRKLPATTDELLKSYGSLFRSKVLRGERNGVEYAFGGVELLDCFYDVFAVNMRDLGTPVFGKRLFASILKELDGDAELCLGAVAESYPPQCSGLPLTNWTWEGVDGSESSGDTTWGAYAVQGTYDGEAFTVTQPPVMLALYDPMAPEDPTGGEPGAGDEQTLQAIQEELPDALGEAYLGSYPDNGWLWVDVMWDDGTWHKLHQKHFGADPEPGFIIYNWKL